ncbi:hypothetical protein STSP2_01101 [Anaerohalosphaera lusitana]|uniref:Uncharacterized protein n=1 Tax=Anaerohalosphaera lusitana TaxID=1936003 RepID=A0A1U9NJ46_9BACT|nr:hypothetical protein [Anaerohalosphaera lusitana]AQT67949.1 hypothetical protein STSP2_01101 [Anaerohalosphaera lusitana]
MKTFTDSSDRTWSINLNIDSAKRVRDLLGVNLLEPENGDPPLLTRLGTDEILLCDVIYCLCKPQADQLNVSDQQFGQSMGGETILAAQKAFYEELIDFFQKRGRRDRAKAVAAQAKVIETAIRTIEQRVDAIDIDKLIDGTISGR